MSKLLTFDCPNCTRPVTVPGGDTKAFTCPHCQAEIIPPDPGTNRPASISSAAAHERLEALREKTVLPQQRSRVDRHTEPQALGAENAPPQPDAESSNDPETLRRTEMLKQSTVLPTHRRENTKMARGRRNEPADETAEEEGAATGPTPAEPEPIVELDEPAVPPPPRSPDDHRLSPKERPKLKALSEVEEATDEIPEWRQFGERLEAKEEYRTWSGIQLLVFGLILLLVAVGVLAFFSADSELVSGDPETQRLRTEVEQTVAMGEKALDVLNRFLASDRIEDQLELVRKPGETAPKLRAYYNRNPEAFYLRATTGVEGVNDFEREGRKFLGIVVSFNDLTIRGVIFEMVDGTPKLDWESLVGFSEMPWEDFVSQAPEGSFDFRVEALPDDYYNFEFNDPERFSCYRLQDPDKAAWLWAYCPKGGPIDLEILRALAKARHLQLPAGEVVLTLRFPDGAKPNDRQVWIEGFVASGHLVL